jgi:hypothetical protein
MPRPASRSGSRNWSNHTLQALATFAQTSPAVRTRLVERLHRYQHSPYKSIASRARKLLAELDTKPGH